MHLGLVGLGKMGGNMRTRLRDAGHTVVGYDRNRDLFADRGVPGAGGEGGVAGGARSGRLCT